MPRLTGKNEIRTILRRDPAWCVYALGDLSPHIYGKTQWFFSGFTPDLALVLHDYGTSILFAMGTGSIREALGHVIWPAHLQVQRDALDEVARHATITSVRLMWRMVSKGARVPASSPGPTRLSADHVPAILRLYADGEASGESPDFFYPSMVTDGVFFGIYEGDALVAAAGTHLLSREESAAAIGNIYTRRDRRGRGLGRIVTSAVLEALTGIETIGLNVRADNDAALHLYESLGFTRHCPFYEALANR
ncbi:MAG: GNAT family N-acetyltransferase [Acidobacteriota bacterium]|nr:GNAT family N-acetyltransferase [Acidobacteriota bacterium]